MSTCVWIGFMDMTVSPVEVHQLSALDAQHVNAGPVMGRRDVPSVRREEFFM